MGIKRLLKKSVFGGGDLVRGHIADALVKKSKTGKSFRECLGESVRETWQEDLPGVSHVYQAGHANGRVQGSSEQAQKDEKKFQQLQDKHDKDRKAWKKQAQQYEDLLDDVE